MVGIELEEEVSANISVVDAELLLFSFHGWVKTTQPHLPPTTQLSGIVQVRDDLRLDPETKRSGKFHGEMNNPTHMVIIGVPVIRSITRSVCYRFLSHSRASL